MPLSIPDRDRLPRIHAQEAEEEPWIYARYVLPGTNLAWHVMEGEPDGEDFLFFGFVAGGKGEFAQFRLSELETVRGPLGECVERDPDFAEGRLTDVVPAPDS